jgi:hypothetical protein
MTRNHVIAAALRGFFKIGVRLVEKSVIEHADFEQLFCTVDLALASADVGAGADVSLA